MNVHQIESPQAYLHYLQNEPHKLDLLFKELLIGVTGFFRNSDAFSVLAHKVLPDLLKPRPDDTVIGAWVPGCSTGEEAYSSARKA